MFVKSLISTISYRPIFENIALKPMVGFLLTALLGHAYADFPVTSTGPMSIAAAPFTASPLSDIAITTEGLTEASTLSVFLNDGTGNFPTETVVFNFGRGTPTFVAVLPAFFNTRNGLIAVNQNGSENCFLFQNNNNNGSFTTPPLEFFVGDRPLSVASAGFQNTLTKKDFVVANTDSTVTAFFGDGAGGFAEPVAATIMLTTPPTSVTAADVNGDGFDDIIVTFGLTNQVAVFLNKGAAVFPPGTSFSPTPNFILTVGTDPLFVTSGVLTNSGFIDLVVANKQANSTSLNGSITVLFGDGTGNFPTSATYAVDNLPTSITLADFTGSGFLDIAVANQASSTITVLINNGGNGSFTRVTPSQAASSGPGSITSGIFSPTKVLPQIAVANTTGGTFSVLTPVTMLVNAPKLKESQKFTQLASNPDLVKNLMSKFLENATSNRHHF